MSLSSSFQFSLKNQVFERLCTIGQVEEESKDNEDGTKTQNNHLTYLAAATTAGKVLIHMPRRNGPGAGGSSSALTGGDAAVAAVNAGGTALGGMIANAAGASSLPEFNTNNVHFLNINRKISDITCGPLKTNVGAKDANGNLVSNAAKSKSKDSNPYDPNSQQTIVSTLHRDILLIATPTSITAYDTEENAELFQKDIDDGVLRVIFGRIGALRMPTCIVGGNCSVMGFDQEGTEVISSFSVFNSSTI